MRKRVFCLTDKEFKRLSRSQLVDIIYQLQVKQKALEDENLKLKEQLADKRIRMRQAGNIAEASLAIHKVMQSAQDAANQYLEEIRSIRAETEKKCQRMLEKAQQEAADIVARAQTDHTSADIPWETIMKKIDKK